MARPEEEAKIQRPRRRNCSTAAVRSAYFARREAARVLKCVLQGDARRRAVGSIKSLVYSPSVRNKKATFALVCQTLKYLPLIKDVLAAADILNSKWKKQEELMYITAYDILFGQVIVKMGDAEKFLMLRKNSLQSALVQLCKRRNVKRAEDLLLNNQTPVVSRPRYIRVNTLKLDVECALRELGKGYMARKDSMVPDLLVLPSGSDLHVHPLVTNGSIFLQGKASSMAAVALRPEPGWKVLDACSAPGNKTVQLAALMRGKGKVIACELHKERIRHLEDTIKRSGASNVDILHGDFLDTKSTDPLFLEVRAILLDPSCSGSGTSTERLDYLLPSYSKDHDADEATSQRVRKLAAFQRKALAHALSFPTVERVVYSTCSIYQTENEDVIKSVLPLATSLNFELATPFPEWPHRGLPVFEGAEHLLRTGVAEGMEGFFIALFVRKSSSKSIPAKQIHGKEKTQGATKESSCETASSHSGTNHLRRRRKPSFYPFNKMSVLMLYQRLVRKSSNKRTRLLV